MPGDRSDKDQDAPEHEVNLIDMEPAQWQFFFPADFIISCCRLEKIKGIEPEPAFIEFIMFLQKGNDSEDVYYYIQNEGAGEEDKLCLKIHILLLLIKDIQSDENFAEKTLQYLESENKHGKDKEDHRSRKIHETGQLHGFSSSFPLSTYLEVYSK